MGANLKTVVRRFGISQGVVQERPRNAAAFEGSRHGRGDLYILVEVLGALPDAGGIIDRLIETVESRYYAASGSVTGGIGAALRAANDLLFEENLSSPREQRGVAGLSCAVLRDGELYLGQIGPALVYLALPDGLRRFPEDSPWLRQQIPGDAERAAWPPLGVRRVIEPRFYHATLSAGDALLLASPALARLANSRAIGETLGQGGDAGERLRALVGREDANLLLVSLLGEEAEPAWLQDEEPAEEEEPEAEAELAPWLPPARPAPRPARPKIAAGAVRGALAGAGRGLLALLKGVLPDRSPEEPAPRPAPKPAPQSRVNGRMVAVLAVLIPILALLFVAAARYQYEQSRQAQVTDLLRQAGEARNTAVSSGQKDAQRNGLRLSVSLIEQALQISPEDADARKMRQDVLDQLDVVSGVQRLFTLWELTDLPAVGAVSAAPSQIIVRDRDLFVLDRAVGRVVLRRLSPARDALEPVSGNAVLVQKGEQRGTIVVGDLLDMVWMPAGLERKTPALLIQERNGSLLEWTAERGIVVLPVANSATWRNPQASGAFNGMYYLLDSAQKRILKYMPTVGGYTSPPTDYLVEVPGVDLGRAVDMAIDGYIYVLLDDGNVAKFLSGKRQPFNIVELDTPFSDPVAIYVTGDDESNGFVYVADAGLARVVQFTKQGQFIRQFRAAEGRVQLDQLRGLCVDEATQRIYLASGSKVYAAQLPQRNVTPAPVAVPTVAR